MKFLISTLLISILATLAGCGLAESNVERGIRDQILHLGNGTEPQEIDPQIVTGVPEHNIIVALLEGLVSEHPETLEPAPGVAERWEISDDARVYTFHFRGNALWSNGEPVTALDFVRSYERMLSPTLGSEYAYMLHYMVNAEAFNRGEVTDFSEVGVQALDDRTLEITLHSPTPYFLSILNHYSWFPVHLPTIEKHGPVFQRGNRWTRPGNFVGNGPFVLSQWRVNQILVVEKSPTYWDADRVRLNAIHFHPIESNETEERAFRSGQIHITNVIPLSKIEVYRQNHPEVLRLDPWLGTYFYRFNVNAPPLDDPRVRRALTLAVDRESLVRNVTLADEQPAYHFTPPNTAGYTSWTRIEGDLEEARRLLAEAGFPGGRGFPTVEILYNTHEAHRTIAEAIQQMWRQNLGIHAGLMNQEWKVYLDSQRTLSYQIARAGWIGDYEDPNTFLNMWVTDGGNNNTGFSHPEYDRLIEEAGGTADPQQRYQILQQAEAILLEELPIMPLYFYTSKRLVHPSVRGWHPTILDHHPYKYVYLENPPR
jgi:oligopeptide transport system substrate-binding protein